MATLEKVMQMKQQGMSEPQIIQILKNEGTSPKEINDALSQSTIKSALNPGEQSQAGAFPGQPVEQTPIYTSEEVYEQFQTPEQEGIMQPSIMASEPMPETNRVQVSQIENQQRYPVEASYGQPPETQEYGQAQGQEGLPEYEGFPESVEYEEPGAYPEYAPQQGTDITTMNDIAEQIVEEKSVKIKKQISSFMKFQDETSMDMENLDKRLNKIENSFNELQVAILRKIGSYGEDIQNIAKEMHQTQESFSKIINPLTDKARQMQEKEPKQKTSMKKKTDFENYLR